MLVGLYEEPEKPSNALEYVPIQTVAPVEEAGAVAPTDTWSGVLCVSSFVKQYLGAPTATDVDALKAENENLKKKNEELTQKVAELTQQLEAAKSQ